MFFVCLNSDNSSNLIHSKCTSVSFVFCIFPSLEEFNDNYITFTAKLIKLLSIAFTKHCFTKLGNYYVPQSLQITIWSVTYDQKVY